MRRVNVRNAGIAAVAAIILQLIATPAEAVPLTYEYTGNPFTFCGYGCPGTGGDNAAPADWADDYIIATLTFEGALASNLTSSDDVLTNLLGWTVTDSLGTFLLSSALGHTLGWEGIPGLQLATDGDGNIVNWVFAPTNGYTNSEGNLVGTGVVTLNPTVICPGCGPNDEDVAIADFAGINVRQDGEWNAASSVPGSWTQRSTVPEPATLTLIGMGLAGSAIQRRRRRSR